MESKYILRAIYTRIYIIIMNQIIRFFIFFIYIFFVNITYDIMWYYHQVVFFLIFYRSVIWIDMSNNAWNNVWNVLKSTDFIMLTHVTYKSH